MTDRLKGFVVTLDADYRDDDAKAILDAIRMVKGVLSVKPVLANVDDQINRAVVRQEMRKRIFEALE